LGQDYNKNPDPITKLNNFLRCRIMTKKISPTRLVLIAIAMLSIQFVCSSSKTMISPVLHEMVKFYKADLGWTSLVGTILFSNDGLGALVSVLWPTNTTTN
jgi:hypothetical protein